MRMVTTIAASPATAQINCFDRNAYSEPNRSRAITAEAENTITSPTNTSSMVTVNSQRSTLTRFAMGIHFTTESRNHAGILLWNSHLSGDYRGSRNHFSSCPAGAEWQAGWALQRFAY